MDKAKLKELEINGHYYSVPRGISMWPLLKNRNNVADIVPFQGLLKKYDVALYYRPTTNQYVLHRILRIEKDCYIFYGDNCWQKEIVPHDMVVGVAARFYRKGKWIDANDIRLRAYAHIWCDVLVVRRVIFRVRDEMKKAVRRVGNDE